VAKYVIYIKFTDDNERRVATRPVHREFLKRMMDEGHLHESGPFTDDSGALMIYNGENQAAVETLFATDPYHTTGGIIDTATFHEWNRVFPAGG